MKFSADQLPFKDFESLGLSKKDVLALPAITLNSLLSGNRTSLMRFNDVKVQGLGTNFSLDAKLSLFKEKDGKLSLRVHPIRPELDNSFELSKKEISHLKKHELAFIPKMVTNTDGKLVESLVTLDRTTNELIAIERDKLVAPQMINGVMLSPAQKKDFVSGRPVLINGKKYQLNPSSEIGISGPDLSTVKIRHSTYGSPNMLLDAVLLTAGLGHYVMLYHLANVLLHSKIKLYDPEKSLQSFDFRNALAEAKKEILERQDILSKKEPGEKKENIPALSMDEIKSIIEKKAGEHVVLDKVEAIQNKEEGADLTVKASEKTDDPDNKLSIEDEQPRSISFKM